jgi:hypothetical protein
VGIAVASSDHLYGLTPSERQAQHWQLNKFAGSKEKNKDLGSAGYYALLDISKVIADDLKDHYYFNTQQEPIPRYEWCGFRRMSNCESDNWRYGELEIYIFIAHWFGVRRTLNRACV